MQILKKLQMLAIAFVFITPLSISFIAPVHAQDITTYLTESKGELSDSNLTDLIGTLINTIISILGIVLLLYIIYAGFLWMTAGGNSEQVDKAKTIMMNAIIGLIILLAAYAIASFVITALTTAGLAE